MREFSLLKSFMTHSKMPGEDESNPCINSESKAQGEPQKGPIKQVFKKSFIRFFSESGVLFMDRGFSS